MNHARLLVAGFIAALILLGHGIDAGAQEVQFVVTPLVEKGSFNRSYTHEDPASGYSKTAEKSDTNQMGFELLYRADPRWSTKFRFTIGGVGTPTRSYRLTDGSAGTNPYNMASNANVEYSGHSRTIEIMEGYTRGMVTYRFGLLYRLLEHTDHTTIFGEANSNSESEFGSMFFGPRLGITAEPRFGRLAVSASIDVMPVMNHSGTYIFRLEGFDPTGATGTITSKGMDVEVSATFRIVKNLGLTGGWRYSAIHTADSSFVLAHPQGVKTPQKDEWTAFYVGIRIR